MIFFSNIFWDRILFPNLFFRRDVGAGDSQINERPKINNAPNI